MSAEDKAYEWAEEMKSLRLLLVSPAWVKLIGPRIESMVKNSREGVRARNKTPEQRAEWVELTHEAEELQKLVPERIKELDGYLRAYQRDALEVSSRVMDLMGD